VIFLNSELNRDELAHKSNFHIIIVFMVKFDKSGILALLARFI
jgi:hypothetical protein